MSMNGDNGAQAVEKEEALSLESDVAAQAKNSLEEGEPEKKNDAEQNWIFMDVCKVIAVLLIVVMHVSAGAWGESEIGSFNWHVLNVYNCLSRIGIPLFFMQVGAVMLNEKNQVSIKTLYSKNLLYIVSAFFIWSAFYMLSYYLLDAPGGFSEFTVGGFIAGLLGGAPYSQWFILLAIGLYLIIPILSAIARDMTVCKYFLILWVIFSVLLPILYRIPALFPEIPLSVAEGLTILANSISQIRPLMVLDFAGYMLLGYWIHNTAFSTKENKLAALLGAAGLVYMVGMTIWFSTRDGYSTETFLGNFSVNVCLMSATAMMGIKSLLKKVWFGPRTYNMLRFFSNVSFGIFLIHDFIRMGMVRLGLNALTFFPLVSVPIITLLVFVISGGVAYWLKALPKAGSYIVGG